MKRIGMIMGVCWFIAAGVGIYAMAYNQGIVVGFSAGLKAALAERDTK